MGNNRPLTYTSFIAHLLSQIWWRINELIIGHNAMGNVCVAVEEEVSGV